MTPPEFLYYLGYSLKKRQALAGRKKLPHKVISIGNITVGGTGKTPAVIAVAEEAKKRGYSPVILTRGYKGKAKGPCIVQKAEARSQRTEVRDRLSMLYGDEPVLMAERLKNVPVVKCGDRYEGGMFAVNQLRSLIPDPRSAILFIIDDGFQHWKLHRDMDIVLIDGTNPFGNKRLLPLGPLREPIKELQRADMFVVTKKRNDDLLHELRVIKRSAPVFFSDHGISGIRDISGNRIDAAVLRGKRVYAFCGIANPESFRQTVLSLDVELCGFRTYRDHYNYSTGDILYVRKQSETMNCDYLITTEKDMVKLRGMDLPENVLYPEISFEVEKEFFEMVFSNIS